jgi:hypothetical protein
MMTNHFFQFPDHKVERMKKVRGKGEHRDIWNGEKEAFTQSDSDLPPALLS